MRYIPAHNELPLRELNLAVANQPTLLIQQKRHWMLGVFNDFEQRKAPSLPKILQNLSKNLHLPKIKNRLQTHIHQWHRLDINPVVRWQHGIFRQSIE